MRLVIRFAFVSLFITARAAFAADTAPAKPAEPAKTAEADPAAGHDEHHGEHHGEHHAHNNHVALFIGSTSTHGHSYATFGLEFERALGGLGGVTFVAERINADHAAAILLLGYNFHWMTNGRFLLGYGQESADGHTSSVMRAAVGWELHVGPVAVTPMVGYDKMDHSTATMAGIAIGKGF